MKRILKYTLWALGGLFLIYVLVLSLDVYVLFTSTHDEQTELVGSATNNKWEITACYVRSGATLPNVIRISLSTTSSDAKESRTLATFRADSDSVFFDLRAEDTVTVTLRDNRFAPWRSYKLPLDLQGEVLWYQVSGYQMQEAMREEDGNNR